MIKTIFTPILNAVALSVNVANMVLDNINLLFTILVSITAIFCTIGTYRVRCKKNKAEIEMYKAQERYFDNMSELEKK